MEQFPPASREPPATDRLNGWKEIATHFGKGVRTVQRWEVEYRLPVHRIGREGGEIVYAYRTELNRWEEDTGPRRATANDDEAPPIVQTRSQWFSTRSRILSLVGVLIVAGGVVTALWEHSGRENHLVAWSIEGGELTGLSRGGRVLWSTKLPFLPDESSYRPTDPRPGTDPVILDDIDGDGSNELALIALTANRLEGRGLFVFNSDGHLRFTFQPTETVRFGNTSYGPPWSVHHFWIMPGRNGTKSIWATFVHGLWFPTNLVQLAPDGRIQSSYWSNGYIESLAVTQFAGRQTVFVGATNNEFKGGSLAVFASGLPMGSSPAQAADYRCRDCGPGSPDVFMIFPQRCVARAMDGQATVNDIMIEASAVHVLVSEGPYAGNGLWMAPIWYTLDQTFTVLNAAPADQLRPFHDEWFRLGRLNHSFGPIDLVEMSEVRKWDGKGFGVVQPPNSSVR